MVGFHDGAIIAHLGMPDMRHPIGFALNYPTRAALPVARLDLAKLAQMTFRAPDLGRYPALRLAAEVMRAGGLAGAAFNAAKEVALDQFIAGALGFSQMSHLVESSLTALSAQFGPSDAIPSLEDVLGMDDLTRRTARGLAARMS